MSDGFSGFLSPREVIRWTGQPRQGLVFRPIDALLVPFSLLWCSFAVLWAAGGWNEGVPFFFLLWGGAFAAIGLYFVVGRFVVDALIRSKVRYALTDHRALILGGLGGNILTAIDLRSTSEIRYKDVGGDRGTIGFGPDPGWFRQRGIWQSAPLGCPEFFQVENALAAYRIIEAARRARGP